MKNENKISDYSKPITFTADEIKETPESKAANPQSGNLGDPIASSFFGDMGEDK